VAGQDECVHERAADCKLNWESVKEYWRKEKCFRKLPRLKILLFDKLKDFATAYWYGIT